MASGDKAIIVNTKPINVPKAELVDKELIIWYDYHDLDEVLIIQIIWTE